MLRARGWSLGGILVCVYSFFFDVLIRVLGFRVRGLESWLSGFWYLGFLFWVSRRQ